jgi:hypothetical protein
MIPKKTLAGAIDVLREQHHDVGKISTNDKYEISVEVDGEAVQLNDVYRRAGFPPVPPPHETVWGLYEGAKRRLEGEKKQLEYFQNGTLTQYWNTRQVPRDESIADVQRHIDATLDEIAMWEKMIYEK